MYVKITLVFNKYLVWLYLTARSIYDRGQIVRRWPNEHCVMFYNFIASFIIVTKRVESVDIIEVLNTSLTGKCCHVDVLLCIICYLF